jgi:hypothetical protein
LLHRVEFGRLVLRVAEATVGSEDSTAKEMQMPDANIWFFHLFPVLVMVGIAFTNNMFNFQRADRRTDLEASRLRAGLSAELRALLDLHASNLRLVESNCDYLLSSRSLLAIYKGNLGRLTVLLDSHVIASVVASFAQNEKIESVLTARAQPKGGSSYKIVPGEMDFQELKQMYERAERSIIAALRALDADDEPQARSLGAAVQPPALEPSSVAAG